VSVVQHQAPTTTRGAIEVASLSKRFHDVVAVDALTVTVQEGQIFGLLGPNGAGKTTTLRALTGLIRPTAGQIRILGEVVRPGAPILRRVGALIEDPGFVPHLSGLANLELFWKAGGQGVDEADLDRALDVASLGDAIRRKVKAYSHGMRQRLAIAQALLGRPDVLVLDEPTTGLDPQQMREMREVVRRIAAGGATVLLSSHLLSEVEQVCTHAAVIDRGRLVATGTVSELMGSATTVYVEVDDPQRATEVLSNLAGVRKVDQDGAGFLVELDGVERKEVVRALVLAGVGVEAAMSRHGLEDAYISMLEAEPR
jgi:ABC-2 type transport system ATP-binding protein